jgi:hypothetical protein
MKYLGSITIVNDEGNPIFERELTQDEIIETLVAECERRGVSNIPDGILVPKELVKIARKTVGSVLAKKEKTGRFTKKECCGSTGTRHFKWCEEAGGTGAVGLKTNKSGRIPFSESTYNTVKSLLNAGTPAFSIVSDKGFDAEEVKKIEESKSYDRYFRAS